VLTVVLVAVAASSCASAGGSVASRVAQWASLSGIQGLDQTVESDLGDLAKARAEHKSLYVKTLCQVLYDDVEQAYVELPSPDQQLTNKLNDAYLNIGNGANDCYAGLGGSDARQANKGYAEVAVGTASLSAATRRLASLGVR
jgi:hypothetical protein